MQKNNSTIADRLGGVLSDLSSFVGHANSSAASPVCESRDRDSFIKRVHSFQSSSWFAKPRWLSPVTCARYGWINVDVDLLHCVGCRSVLVVRAPSSFDPAIYDACQKRLEDQLKRAAHHPCCTWPSCPTPEPMMLAHGGSSNQPVVVEGFINSALLLYSVAKDLPAVEHLSLNVTESDVTSLCSLVRNSPKFLHDAEIPGALEAAVLLALTGWDLSDAGKAIPGCTSLQCSVCMRQPGLWNYISIVGGNDRVPSDDNQSNGEFLLGHHTDARNESAEGLQIASSCSPCYDVDGQISSYETDDRSLIGDVSFPAAEEDLLPSGATDKCVDLQLLSQDAEATGDTLDRLPSISELGGVGNDIEETVNEADSHLSGADSVEDDPCNINNVEDVLTERSDSALCDNETAEMEFHEEAPLESESESSAVDTDNDEPRSLAVNSDKDDDSENTTSTTSDIPGVTDTDECGDHSDTAATDHESLSAVVPSESENDMSSDNCEIKHFTELTGISNEIEKEAFSGLQTTDASLRVEEESNTVDTNVSEEIDVEQINSDDGSVVCPNHENTSNQNETEIGAVGSDVEETVSDADDELTKSDDVEDDACISSNSNEPCSLLVDADEDGEIPSMSDNDKQEEPAAIDHESLSALIPSECEKRVSSGDGEVERFTELTGSLGEVEKEAFEELQTTDDNCLFSCDKVQEEADTVTVDAGVYEETEVEQSKSDGDGLDVRPENINPLDQNRTEIDAMGSDVEETVNDSGDQLTRSDNMENDECVRYNAEDMSAEQPSSASCDNKTVEMEFCEEAPRASESQSSAVDSDGQNEDIESSSQESLEMKSTDSDMDTVTVGDGLQQVGSVTGLDSELEHNADRADIVEDVRQLLAGLIDDVVQDYENDCTRKSLKRRATDIPTSVLEPPHKQPFSTVRQQIVFDPVAEHHHWCPYVSDSICDGPDDVARGVAEKPWLRLLRRLVPDPQAALTQVQTSPVPLGIERIRKLFRSWTSTA